MKNNSQKGSVAVIVIIIAVVVIAILIGYYYMQNPTASPTTYSSGTNSDTEVQAELSNLEQENSSQDFSSIESDFGAEVNAAVR